MKHKVIQKIPLRIHRTPLKSKKKEKTYKTIPPEKNALKTQINAFFQNGIRVIPALILASGLVVFPAFGRTPRIAFPAQGLTIPIKKDKPAAFKVLSHIALSAGTAGTWGATNGATLFVKKDAQVLYTGTNPSREFDTTEGWKSNYRTFSGFLGVKFNWFALGGEFESFTMVPKEDRFTMENTKYGIAVSLPTVDIKGTVFSLRGEVRIAPNGPLSPYIALSYPVAHSLKSQGYNSDPEPKEVKNEAWTIYGVNVTPYKNMKIPAAFSPAFELGFGIRLKGSLRLRISAKYRRLDWNLFYHKHQDEVILIGANVSI